MTKDETSAKIKEKKSPIAIAQEAIDAGKKMDSDLPPHISFGGSITQDDVVKAAQATMIDTAFSRIQKNVVDGALAQSERFRVEEDQRLVAERAKAVQPVAPSSNSPPPLFGGGGGMGGLLNPMASTDRAALLDAALKNLASDEAKIKFMADHPELLSTSPLPFPGMQQSGVQSQIIPQPSPVSANNDMIASVISMIQTGIELQRTATPQQVPPVSQSPPIDVINIVTTFKEMAEKTNAAYTEIVKTIQDQNRASQDAAQKALAESQSKIIQLQMESKDKETEYLRNRMGQLEDALRAPPVVTIDKLRETIESVRAGGVPVSLDTPDQEVTRARIIREDKLLEHQLSQDSKKIDLELIKEKRRGAATNAVVAGLSGIFETQVLKKHSLSSDGAAVSGRFG
jgi:hypothetical protein